MNELEEPPYRNHLKLEWTGLTNLDMYEIYI